MGYGWRGRNQVLLFDEDITELSTVYINMSCNNEEEKRKQARLSDIVFDDNGNTLVEFVSVEEFESAVRNGAKVIVCGFLP